MGMGRGASVHLQVCGTRVGCFGGGGSVTTRVVVFQTGLSSSSGTAVLERFALVLESAVK